ncbi:MAG: trypsin-like peptidase domain-containing protein [Phycisphaerae bacterium]
MRRLAFTWCVVALMACLGCHGVQGAAPAENHLATLDFRQVVQSAKDKVFPAVVYIKVIRETHEAGKKISQEISGSGVIVSPEGEVLTNWHVVDKAVQVRCLLYDGRAMDAEVAGTDKDTDLAVVRLKRSDTKPVPFAALGDSDVLKEGDFVMAMGAPWGLSRSVSIGIVSCTHRFLPESSEYSLWLQTDASISPGNSGGPLVNTDGQVVGINTLGALMGGDMGFSVPSNTIRYILAQIREFGKVNWSWTGLQLQPLRDFDRNIYFEGADGVIVAETDPESPARHAGLLPRDRILEIAGQPVSAVTSENLPSLRRLLGLLPKGQPADIKFLRNEKVITVQLTPREKGKVEGAELDCPRWDLTVKQINQFDNPELYFHRKEGVFIYGVKSPGNAGNADLRPKDIILSIDGREVKTLDDVKRIHAEAIENVEKQHRIMFSVLRNGLLRQMVLDFSRDYEKE